MLQIVAITPDTYYSIPVGEKSTWVVTALNRLDNESRYKKVKF